MSNVTVLPCCTVVYRDHPSRVRKYHSRRCLISPGAEIVATVDRRAEVSSRAVRDNAHDWRTCRVPDCEACDYTEAWLDQAYEQAGGR